jgi:glucan biosynthesis protein
MSSNSTAATINSRVIDAAMAMAEITTNTSSTSTSTSIPIIARDLEPNQYRDGFMKLPRHLKEMIVTLI